MLLYQLSILVYFTIAIHIAIHIHRQSRVASPGPLKCWIRRCIRQKRCTLRPRRSSTRFHRHFSFKFDVKRLIHDNSGEPRNRATGPRSNVLVVSHKICATKTLLQIHPPGTLKLIQVRSYGWPRARCGAYLHQQSGVAPSGRVQTVLSRIKPTWLMIYNTNHLLILTVYFSRI